MVASDDHYQSVTQSRKWTNCPSTKVETVEQRLSPPRPLRKAIY
jgi:hypothetical protein